MANDAGDRTEAPTPRRRQEARQRGQIARSTDLSSAILLLGAMICLRWFGPQIIEALLRAMEEHLTVSDPSGATKIEPMRVIASILLSMLGAVGPLLGGLVVLGIFSNIIQVGFIFTTQPLELNLTKLNPLSGFSRLVSTRTAVQLIMNLIKLIIVTIVAYTSVRDRMPQIVVAMDVGGWQQLALLTTVIYDIGLKLAIILLVIGLVDYIWQRWRLEQDLKMTKEEVKEEMRRMEGDPQIKQRRRKMQFVALMQQIRKNVPKADVVVTNPTEYAVAIQYDAENMGAPKVVAKGKDEIARKIREVAIAHGVPIVERKAIAQALYRTVDVGQEIPESLYKAIAEILAYVYELTGKAKRLERAPAA